MGARPIAVLDALRFGDPADPRTRHLVDGVVRGVGGYGNCVGVPTVGGELVFDPSYQGNPLVNVMAIGLVREERDHAGRGAGTRATSSSCSAATTGRDGIGGASVLASATFGDEDPSKRPAVQVGDPFAEKLLIEASLELIERGLVEGLQDLGAAGITCARLRDGRPGRDGDRCRPRRDPAPRARHGALRGDDLRVPGADGRDRPARPPRGGSATSARAGACPCAVIGRVTADGDITVVEGGLDAGGLPLPASRELARIPARALTSDAIVHAADRGAAGTPPARPPRPGIPDAPVERLPERGMDPGAVLARPPRVARTSRRDDGCTSSTTTTSRRTPSRAPGAARPSSGSRARRQALVATTDCDQAVAALDPWLGAALSRRRGDAQRGDHRRPAAGRDELPQLRRPDAAGGVLAAEGSRPRARRRLPGARAPGHRRQRLALQRVAGRARSPRRPRSASSACSTTSSSSSGPAFPADGDAVLLVGRGDAGPRRLGLRRARRRRRPRTARRRSTSPARRPSRRSSARRSRAGLVASAQDVSRRRPGRGPRRDARSGAAGARRFRAPGGRLAGRGAVRREPLAAGRRGPAARTCRRSGCSRASTALPVDELGTVGGDRLVIELAGAGATGAAEERGARRRRRARASPSATFATPGSTGCRGRSAGRARA